MKSTGALLAALTGASALSIAEINGNKFVSEYDGKSVCHVEGLVTAVSEAGFYLRSTKPDDDAATSEGLYVYSNVTAEEVAVGDVVTVGGKILEYR